VFYFTCNHGLIPAYTDEFNASAIVKWWRYYVFGLSLTSVRLSVCLDILQTRYFINCLGEFHQIYNFSAFENE